MQNIKDRLLEHWEGILLAAIAMLVAVIASVGITIKLSSDGEVEITPVVTPVVIEYAEEQVPALLENEDGEMVETTEINGQEIPTVDEVDGGEINECPAESEECAKGAVLPEIDISSFYAFYRSVIDQCVDFDGAYGSQCYDPFAYFHYVYTGKWLSTNGTGSAYGIWDAREFNNPINPETGETYYVLVEDPRLVKTGAFPIYYGGLHGHVGAAAGDYNNGYIALLGANQGGRACPGGGAAVNVINMSVANFRGAFMPRIWIEPEPTPEAPDTGTVKMALVYSPLASLIRGW